MLVMDHAVTPRLSRHARERCAEMGISTRVAKRIYQHRTTTRPGNTETGCVMVTSEEYPDYAVVVNEAEQPPVIVTVVFRTTEPYIRNGTTFEVVTDE